MINEESYKFLHYKPGDLLYEYTLNLKLLEGCYLFLIAHEVDRDISLLADDEQLFEEKATWTYYPKHLNEEYLKRPYKALKQIFSKVDPQTYREALYLWLEAALYDHAIDEVTPPIEVIEVYENLLLLYDIAWIVRQRRSDEPDLKDNVDSHFRMKKISDKLQLKSLFQKVREEDTDRVDKFVSFISGRFEIVEQIYYLGYADHPATIYLVIIINDDEKTEEGEIGNKIEDHCKHLGEVLLIMHKVSALSTGRENHSRFWTDLAASGNQVYSRAQIINSSPLTLRAFSVTDLINSAKFHWKRWGGQSRTFVQSAEYYYKKDDYVVASFMLNQAMRYVLKAVIQSIIGYRVQAHNLSRLIRLSQLISDELKRTLKLDDIENAQLFNFIKEASHHAQFQDSFAPDKMTVKAAISKVKKFHLVGQAINLKYINDLKDEERKKITENGNKR